MGTFGRKSITLIVKGLHLITLYYTDPSGKSLPINYRIYDKREGRTKNDYFRDMVTEVLASGLYPEMITGDAWYSSQENRKVSLDGKEYTQVESLEILESGLIVYLKSFGRVKVCAKNFQKRNPEILHYIPK